MALRESPGYEAQWREAAQTIAQCKPDAAAQASGVGYGPDPDLPECPWHGEYLDDDDGCCLCEEETGDPFAYQAVEVVFEVEE